MKGGSVDSSREWLEETKEDFNQPICSARDYLSRHAAGKKDELPVVTFTIKSAETFTKRVYHG